MVIAAILLGLLAPIAPSSAAQPAPVASPTPAPLAEELVLPDERTITVMINGEPVRLEVSGEAFGPPVVNPEIATRLGLVPVNGRGWLVGPVSVSGYSGAAEVDFGAGPRVMQIGWSPRQASARADGVIGIYDLPWQRVVFRLGAPAAQESVQRLGLKRAGGRSNARLGTEVEVGKKKLMMVFALDRDENLVTAPTADFLATHLEGGFVPGLQGMSQVVFGIRRPTRTMRIARPLELGEIAIEAFAVRVEDYGTAGKVGEIARDDPRFRKGQILVSRRKGRGRPDLLTRIGRDQIAHCSTLTYDLAAEEIRLSCAPPGG